MASLETTITIDLAGYGDALSAHRLFGVPPYRPKPAAAGTLQLALRQHARAYRLVFKNFDSAHATIQRVLTAIQERRSYQTAAGQLLNLAHLEISFENADGSAPARPGARTSAQHRRFNPA